MAAAQKPSVHVEIPPSLKGGSVSTTATTTVCMAAQKNV